MIRLLISRTILAGAFVWVITQSAPAQNATSPSVSPQTQKINELIRKGYETAGIKKPAARASDHEFLRRVFIDLIGRIATPEEVIDFENDRSPDKRVKLVQRLLTAEKYQPKDKSGKFILDARVGAKRGEKPEPLAFNYAEEFASHWADIWTVWLMTRSGHQDYREQMHIWLEEQFRKNLSHKELVTKLLTATGQVGGAKMGTNWPYKEDYAANFIIHHLGDAIRDPNERARVGAFDAVPVTSRVTRLFLGLQTQCTQCHDHPFNKEWVQTDFWGVNAFFRQTVRSATPSGAPIGNNPKMVNAALVTLTDDKSLNTEMLVYYERRDGRRLGSFPIMLKDYEQAMNGQKSSKMLSSASANGTKSRREQLADWVVAHDNFSKAYANRIWAHFFGRGLNKEPAADDFGSNNEIVHPELLNFLGEEFVKYGYQPKQLMEWICTSDVYQLSHVANKEYTDIKYDPFFARMPLKAMSPEVLFESLMTATKGKRTKAQQAERMETRTAWMRKLVRQFGDDEGNELSFNGTVVQALLMMNGAEINGEIGVNTRNAEPAKKGSFIHDIVARHKGKPLEIYDELFLMTLNRHYTPEEKAKLEAVRNGQATISVGPAAPPKGPTKGPKTPPAKGPTKPAKGSVVPVPGIAADQLDPAKFYQDVFWALLNTNEFMLNH